MLVAASSATISHKASCQRFCKVRVSAKKLSAKSESDSLAPRSNPQNERRKRTYVTTDRNKNDRTDTTGYKLFHAMAHRSLGGDRGCQRSLLLVSHGPFPSGRC